MILAMKRVFSSLIVALCLFGASAFIASAQTSQSSANFQNTDTGVVPAQFSQTSANFVIDAALEPIVGLNESLNYTVEVGTQVRPGTVTPPPPSGGGGGGGSGGQPPVPPEDLLLTLEYHSPTFRNTQKLIGKRDSNITSVMINGSSNNTLFDGLTWYTTQPLFIGMNSITVQGSSPTGLSKILTGAIRRLLIGDSNIDGHVDDADLSILVRKWKAAEFLCDFNEDEIVDDADLSLLIAHWGMTY